MSEAAVVPITGLFGTRGGFVPHSANALTTTAVRALDDPYRRGLEDGQAMAEAAFSVERAELQRLVANAEALRREDNPEIAFMLKQMIMRLVGEIAGNAATEPVFLIGQIDEALAIISEAEEARSICVHPDDFSMLQNADLPLALKPDPSLPRGAIRIECSQGWVEHGSGFALQKLGAALGCGGVS
jgi:flagellar assembly protein FliH